jgi:5S rRNA maturation endonuclease (ribonuclease M5)
MLTEAFLERLEGVRGNGSGWTARCPAHDDRTASLSIRDAGDQTLIWCHATCNTEEVLEAMGLDWSALWADGQSPNGMKSPYSREPEATYIYEDERGSELYRVIRYPGKRFRHERRTVPYRLLAVIGAVKEGRTVYICEGEKDVHALEAAGRIATCNAGGAGSWKPEYEKYFKGAKVIVVADNDEPGIRHAKDVAAMLYAAASRIWIVQALVGKDATDHLEHDLSVEDLHVLAQVK